MKTALLLLALPGAGLAQIGGVRVETTNTQALISYQAPTAAACSMQVADMNLPVYISSASGDGVTVTVDTRGLAHALRAGQTIYIEGSGVSQWEGWQTVASVANESRFTFSNATAGSAAGGLVGALAHDVNPLLFAGSDSDTRSGSISSGRSRTFVAGSRKSEISGGVSYSRALQANSRHRFTITCGGDRHSGEFYTANIALGQLAVDVPKPAAPGLSAWPTLDKSGRWEKSGGVYLDRVIDPITGAMYTQMYPPEMVTDTAYNVSTANTPEPAGTNWTNPGSVRTQDGATASYAAATQDVLVVKPFRVELINAATKAAWYTQNLSLENVTVTVRGFGAAGASAANREIEVALSRDGGLTAATNWQTLTLPEATAGNVSFPGGIPQGGFGDWHSATQRRLHHIDVVTRRGFVNTSGTAATLNPDATFAWISMFDTDWGAGSKIRIGGTTNDACNAGTEYDIASVESPRNLTLSSSAGDNTNAWWCAPGFAVLVRKKSASTDQIDIDYVNFTLRTAHIPSFTASGSAKIFSEKPVADSDGNEGYLSYVIGMGGGPWTVHWVSKDNGESRFIMGHSTNFPARAGTDGWLAHGCLATENTFGSTDPTAFYCAPTGNSGGQVLVRYKIWWDGDGRWRSRTPSSTPIAACSTTSPASPNPCLDATNLHSGYTLTQLLQARNPEFDPAKYAACSIRGIQSHFAVLQCLRSVQDTVAWFGVYDVDKPIASYNPADQSTNPVVGLISTMHPSMGGTAVLHSALTVPGSDHVFMFSPKFGRRSNNATDNNGAGPWAMRIVGNAALNGTTDVFTCPANQWNHTQCSTVRVTSQPFDPDPGAGETGAPGEYGDARVGDGVYLWRCDPAHPNYTHETHQEGGNRGCDSYANREHGRILAISGTAPDITLTIARGVVSGLGPKDHASGWSLYIYSLTPTNQGVANAIIAWDMAAAPTGTPASGVQYISLIAAHVAATGRALVGGVGSGGYGDVAWPDPTPGKLALPPPVNMNLPNTVWPAFAGKMGIRFANTIQQYKANNHLDYPASRDNEYRFYIDSRPFIATPGASFRATWEKVGGANYIYRYKQQQDNLTALPYFKHIPYWIAVGYRTLMEKSGPSTTLADHSTDHWKFCTAYRAGECWLGSVAGDIFLNAPYANLTNLADYTCYGGNGWGEADICGSPLDPVAGPNVQFYYGNSGSMGRGRHVRKLGWGLMEVPKMISQVPKVYPTGEWLGPLWGHFMNLHKANALMMKLPPIPADDTYDRTTFVPVPVTVGSAPAGTAVAQIEFGYHDFGTPSQLYCTVRQESCLATGTKVIGDAVVSNQYATTNPAAAYAYQNVSIAASTPVRLTFPSAHKFTSDVRLKATIGTAALNNKLWSISIVDSTTLDLVGSTSGDVSTGSQWVMVPATEAPFAFSGELFSVAGATNAAPIEISTTTMHRFQTGSNVCLSGVGGNTAANGCWTVTVAGPSVFTLNSSNGTAAGAYTSGGRVVPGGVPCVSGCTVVVPAFSKRVMYYRWRYLSESGSVVSTSSVQTLVTP